MTSVESLGITPVNYAQFKDMYDTAVQFNQDTFLFEGHPVLTRYAKYVCQYLDTKYPVSNDATGNALQGEGE